MVSKIIVSFSNTLLPENGESCITPNKEKATCVPFRSCEIILSAVLTENSSAIEFARKSQCGFDNGGLVCCGSSAYFASSPSVTGDNGPQRPGSNMNDTANKKNGESCITPNKEKAMCVPFRSCEIIFSAVLTKNSSAIEFASKSQCGFDNGGLVCCGTLAYFASAPSVTGDKGPQRAGSNMNETANKNRGDPCISPNNEPATCIAARSCKLIIDALRTREPMAIDFAKKSQCGYDTEPLLCCGSSAYFNRVGAGSNKVDINKVLPDRSICGLDKESTRVKGGEVTDIDEFPWMAALEYKKKSTGVSQGIKCGGSVITDRYILTAAHCLKGDDVLVSRAWLGEWNITTDPDCSHTECADPVQKINIARIIPHSGFSKATTRNDVGLLRLEKAVTFTEYIRPICLPTENFPNPWLGSILTVAGWGINDDGEESDVKLKVDVPLLSNAACNAKLGKRLLTANQYCAGGEDGRDSCRGDSGGPLMRAYRETINTHPQWYQEGIVSFGISCGRSGYPAIYTRVSKYTNWIVNTILADKF